MEVAVPMDFDFNNSLSNDGGYYTSAPSSPTRLTDVYCEFDELLIASATANHRGNCLAAVPFAWEEKPGVPKSLNNSFEDDFSFDVSCHFGTDSVQLPAEDLFHGGVIKTVDPNEKKEGRERGRERGSPFSRLPSSRSRRTRSLSPLGSSDQRREQQLRATYMIPPLTAKINSSVAPSGANSSENGSRKWSFMDFLLFRSASDGRAMDRDPLKKYSATFRKHDQDIRNSGSVSKRKGRVSAHEIHYNVNRAVSNDMKKKTYLPYKQGILGRFSFNP